MSYVDDILGMGRQDHTDWFYGAAAAHQEPWEATTLWKGHPFPEPSTTPRRTRPPPASAKAILRSMVEFGLRSGKSMGTTGTALRMKKEDGTSHLDHEPSSLLESGRETATTGAPTRGLELHVQGAQPDTIYHLRRTMPTPTPS